jgi:multicomponent K+:H+ antiporter subunit D
VNPSHHLIILPIVLPLAAGAVMLLIDERRLALKGLLSLTATVASMATALALVVMVDASAPHVYRLGNWPAPYGIVLVADRLSAVLVLLASVLGSAAILFSFARWDRAGPRFHALVQFLLMGVNGAFLTGDLFNLFVFFEVLLVASYGLALHGSGRPRVRASLHYITINLLASLLFLVGAALIYGTTGTLNMADLAVRVPRIASEDRGLLEAGGAALGIAFVVKAGMWPLGLWLPRTYASTSPPAAALFALLTKVGVYAILRTSLLFFAEAPTTAERFGADVLMIGGLATLAFGCIGVLASQQLPRLAGYSLLVSAGTLLAATATGNALVTSAALYYLVVSTCAASALFLLTELLDRGRAPGAEILAVTAEAYVETEEQLDPEEEVGIAIPGTVALLGSSFVLCALVVAGLPPLAGFIGKFALLHAMFDTAGLTPASSVMLALLMISSLTAVIALGRAGVRRFWAVQGRVAPVGLAEVTPILVLLGLCALLTVYAGSAMRYFQAAADALHQPQGYIEAVMTR